MVLDLVDPPMALQLEWPQAAALDLFHRIERAVQQPTWEFHPSRRLGDIRRPVILESATQPQDAVPSVTIAAGDVTAPLLRFDAARPSGFTPPPPLALEVVYRWRRVPAALPPGARQAEIVKRWTAVDEWSSRQITNLRAALADFDMQETGVLARLRRWLPSRDAAVIERRQLAEDLTVIGEARLSENPENAQKHAQRIGEIARRLQEMKSTTHEQRQDAEDAQAEEAQRAAWEQKVGQAKASLEEARLRLGEKETAMVKALEDEKAAEAMLNERVAELRASRSAGMEKEIESGTLGLEAVREEYERLPKQERKEKGRRIGELEQSIARLRRDLKNAESWQPPATDLGAASAPLAEAKKNAADLRASISRLNSEVRSLDRAAAETFNFEAPPRLATPSRTETAPLPPIPDEAPPELGDLYEHAGQRFLAIRTWEQLRRAEPVARRLGALLVVTPALSK